ncbi:MAG: vanadium-dependent haloperoxidase [Pseudomonadota bacterium]
MIIRGKGILCWWLIGGVAFAMSSARADAVTDWNALACAALLEAKSPPGPAHRTLAMAHTAVYEAANAITQRYPASRLQLAAPPGASVAAAVAAANRAILDRLVPSQQAAIDSAYAAAIERVAEGAAKTDGIAVGENAARLVLDARAADGAAAVAVESWRPATAAGVYVPTAMPVSGQWAQRTPWLMGSAADMRPGPPAVLEGAIWARDYNEVKAIGGKRSTLRSAEQSAIAKFWEATQPSIFYELVRGVASRPGRDVMRNARLFAAMAQGIDDAIIAVFDAKYHYNFWRPLTAIRNGDVDGNAATERDPTWLPFLDTPMHPEYPCAHCVASGVVGAVLAAEIGAVGTPLLSTSSPSANGATRSWKTLDGFMQEVASARIYGGMHFRYSTEVGTATGKRIGALAAAWFQIRPD